MRRTVLHPEIILSSTGASTRVAEPFNSLYKSELIYKDGPWIGREDVEHATLDYVD